MSSRDCSLLRKWGAALNFGKRPSLKILGYVVAWTLSTLYLFHEYHEYSGLSFLNFEFRIFAGEDEKREKEDVIWRRKIYFLQRRRKSGKEKEENIWRRKMCFFWEEKKTVKEKEDHLQVASQTGGTFVRGRSIQMIICKRPILASTCSYWISLGWYWLVLGGTGSV